MTRTVRPAAVIAAALIALAVAAALVGGLGAPTTTGLGRVAAWFAGVFA